LIFEDDFFTYFILTDNRATLHSEHQGVGAQLFRENALWLDSVTFSQLYTHKLWKKEKRLLTIKLWLLQEQSKFIAE